MGGSISSTLSAEAATGKGTSKGQNPQKKRWGEDRGHRKNSQEKRQEMVQGLRCQASHASTEPIAKKGGGGYQKHSKVGTDSKRLK